MLAGRGTAGAERGAQIHHALVVGADPAGRRESFGQRPEPLEDSALSGPTLDAEGTCQHPLHVAVEDRMGLVQGEGEHRTGRGTADAGQCKQGLERRREYAAVQIPDQARRAVEIAGTGVVAEPGPEGHQTILRGLGKVRHRRELRDETLEIGDHDRDLRLLQHDLRDPDPVRRRVALPGQILAPVPIAPGEHGRAEPLRGV